MSENVIPIRREDLNEEIMKEVDDIFKDMREEILESLQMDRETDMNEEHGFNKIVIKLEKKRFVDLETIKEIINKQDKRWPITIWDANNEKGYRIDKNWIHDLHINWYPIIDHPRRLGELFVDAGLEDRVLVAQPYPYSDDDRKKLEEFCEKNHLKFIERDLSPYYPGCGLIIIFEEDVGDHLLKCLNIDKLNIDGKKENGRAYMNRKER